MRAVGASSAVAVADRFERDGWPARREWFGSVAVMSGGWQRANVEDRYVAGLAVFAVAYGIFHHGGTLFSWLGEVPGSGGLGETRWADWLDVSTPYLVLLPAVWALAVGVANRSSWVLFAVGQSPM